MEDKFNAYFNSLHAGHERISNTILHLFFSGTNFEYYYPANESHSTLVSKGMPGYRCWGATWTQFRGRVLVRLVSRGSSQGHQIQIPEPKDFRSGAPGTFPSTAIHCKAPHQSIDPHLQLLFTLLNIPPKGIHSSPSPKNGAGDDESIRDPQCHEKDGLGPLLQHCPRCPSSHCQSLTDPSPTTF